MPDAALFNTGKSGVQYAMYSHMETKFQAAVDDGADIIAIPFPKQNRSDVSHMSASSMGWVGMPSVAISTECKNVDKLLAAFNYLFTDPGFLLANYGVEGDTYNMVNGEVVLTQKMLDNISDGIRLYTIPSGWGPAYIEPDRQNVAFSERVNEAQRLWTPDDMALYVPSTVTYTIEEQAELTNILGDLLTYEDEYFMKVVTGQASLDDWDKFVAECKKQGMERAVEIKDAAYQRYVQRSK